MANLAQMTLEDLIEASIDRDKEAESMESPAFEVHAMTVRVNQFDKARITLLARILDVSRQELLLKFVDEGLTRAMAKLDESATPEHDWYNDFMFQCDQLQKAEDEVWASMK